MAVVLCAAACQAGHTGGQHPLTLTLGFDAAALSGCLNCQTIDNCSLDCGGVIGLYLVDPDSGALVGQEECIPFASLAGAKLRGITTELADYEISDGVAVGRRLQLEMAVYSPYPFGTAPGDAGSTVRCDRPVRSDSSDLPSTPDGMHFPSFWGVSDPFTVRDGDNPVTVVLGCVADGPECSTRPDARIETKVIDLKTQLTEVDLPRELDVRFGQLLYDLDGTARFALISEVSLPPGTLPADPTWSVLVPNAVTNPDCLATSVERTPAGLPVVSCDGRETLGTGTTPTQVRTSGYTIDRSFVDKLLADLSLTTLPPKGIIIGKVVDEPGNPVEGAVVTPLEGTAQVKYLDADAVPSDTLTATSSSGWFVVTVPPELPATLGAATMQTCCQIFRATRGSDVGCSSGPVGTVSDTIMGARIVLDPLQSSCTSPKR